MKTEKLRKVTVQIPAGLLDHTQEATGVGVHHGGFHTTPLPMPEMVITGISRGISV